MVDDATAASGLTPYPAVNQTVRLARDWLMGALGPRLVGLYIAGSLALGDFDPLTSDIDLVAVTSEAVAEGDVARLAPLRAYLAAHGGAWGKRVEMAITGRHALSHWRPNQRVFFFTHHEEPALFTQGPEWTIIRAILLARGGVVAGPPPAALLELVSASEIEAAARDTLRQTWSDFAAHPPRHADTRFYIVFAVETMCRALMTITGGGLPSKPQAMAWAATHLPEEWRPLITQARDWRAKFTDDHDLTLEPAVFPEALRFIHYAVAQARIS